MLSRLAARSSTEHVHKLLSIQSVDRAVPNRDFHQNSLITNPVFDVFEGVLVELQSLSGLPWWISVASFAPVITAAMLPIYIWDRKAHRRRSVVDQYLLLEKIKAFEKYVKGGLLKAKEFDSKWWQYRQKTIKSNKVQFFRLALGFPIRVGVFISSSTAVRNVSLSLSDFQTQGLSWCENLQEVDPLQILPITFCTVSVAHFLIYAIPEFLAHRKNKQMSSLSGGEKVNVSDEVMGALQTQQKVRFGMLLARTFTTATMITIMTTASLKVLPAAVPIYWTSMAVCNIVQQQMVNTYLSKQEYKIASHSSAS